MDSANTFSNMLPIFKEAYASKAMATHKRPGAAERFKSLKQKLKKKQ